MLAVLIQEARKIAEAYKFPEKILPITFVQAKFESQSYTKSAQVLLNGKGSIAFGITKIQKPLESGTFVVNFYKKHVTTSFYYQDLAPIGSPILQPGKMSLQDAIKLFVEAFDQDTILNFDLHKQKTKPLGVPQYFFTTNIRWENISIDFNGNITIVHKNYALGIKLTFEQLLLAARQKAKSHIYTSKLKNLTLLDVELGSKNFTTQAAQLIQSGKIVFQSCVREQYSRRYNSQCLRRINYKQFICQFTLDRRL